VVQYPTKAKRKAVPEQHVAVAVCRASGYCLLYKRPEKGLLAGLWCFPMREIDELQEEAQVPRSRLPGHNHLRQLVD
jgi:A/G-specific adenine glycosylase